jgi:hypothetical protein
MGHTPGPWTTNRTRDDDGNRSIGTTRGALALLVVDGGYTASEQTANARLIAAAPDLLEELIAAQAAIAMVYAGRKNWHGHLATLETVSSAMKSARAEIAKAGGAP